MDDCWRTTARWEDVRHCGLASPCGIGGRLARSSQKAICLTETSKVREVGLDYHAHGSRQERREQQDYLRRFLPQVSHLPVVLHCRSSDTHPHQARVDLLADDDVTWNNQAAKLESPGLLSLWYCCRQTRFFRSSADLSSRRQHSQRATSVSINLHYTCLNLCFQYSCGFNLMTHREGVVHFTTLGYRKNTFHFII